MEVPFQTTNKRYPQQRHTHFSPLLGGVQSHMEKLRSCLQARIRLAPVSCAGGIHDRDSKEANFITHSFNDIKCDMLCFNSALQLLLSSYVGP